MENDQTPLRKIEVIIDDFLKRFTVNRRKTLFLLVLLIIVTFISVGLVSVAPRIFDDLYSKLFHQTPDKPFSNRQIIYSNFVPFDYDIIDLDRSGTLTPSPYNKYFDISSTDVCSPSNKPLIEYSQGIVMVLNLPSTLSSRDFQDSSKLARGIKFEPPPLSDYFVFEVGKSETLKTDGRIFKVTLSRVNDLSTPENGEYYSYVFDINEK